MHWILVGILIWIGLAIAPAVINFIAILLPFVVGATIGVILLAALTQNGGWIIIGFIVGGVAPYVIYNKMNE